MRQEFNAALLALKDSPTVDFIAKKTDKDIHMIVTFQSFQEILEVS